MSDVWREDDDALELSPIDGDASADHWGTHESDVGPAPGDEIDERSDRLSSASGDRWGDHPSDVRAEGERRLDVEKAKAAVDAVYERGHEPQLGVAAFEDAATNADLSGAASIDQRDAIRDYTGVGSSDLNKSLREGTISEIERIAERSSELSSALEMRPIHEGTVLRGSTTDLTDEALARYEPGERVVEQQYLSTTVDADREFGGNVIWVIESNQGRDVADVSSISDEREVLFDRMSTFDVLAKEYSADLGRWVIYMEETH